MLQGTDIFMQRYQVHTLDEYVVKRLEEIEIRMDQEDWEHRMIFCTPLTLKYQNVFLQEFRMEAIVAGWGALKLTGGVLTLAKLIDGIKGLTMTGAADGAAAGAAWGGEFASAVLKAAPWLVGLYTMLNPAETGNNDLFANGKLTPEGWADVY